MESSQFTAFIERLRTDEALREKFFAAERLARRNVLELEKQITELGDANLAELKRIAKEAGFDLSEAFRRPRSFQTRPSDHELDSLSWNCIFTCCFVLTSAYSTETFPSDLPGGCGEGPPWMTI
jgi:hypothetical protein